MHISKLLEFRTAHSKVLFLIRVRVLTESREINGFLYSYILQAETSGFENETPSFIKFTIYIRMGFVPLLDSNFMAVYDERG